MYPQSNAYSVTFIHTTNLMGHFFFFFPDLKCLSMFCVFSVELVSFLTIYFRLLIKEFGLKHPLSHLIM